MEMLGLDAIGADSGGIVKAGAKAVSDITDAVTKKDEPAALKLKPIGDDESFLEKSIVGPVKVWMAAVAAALAGGVWYWKRK